MEAIITAATVMAMYLNVTTSGEGPYAYNADIENGRVNSLVIFEDRDDSLTPKLQYSYKYDEDGRLVAREDRKWNSWRREYEPYRLTEYQYGDEGYTVQLRRWNRSRNAYGDAVEKMEYSRIGENVMAVDTYRRDKGSDELTLCDNFLVMHPDLMALKDRK